MLRLLLPALLVASSTAYADTLSGFEANHVDVNSGASTNQTLRVSVADGNESSSANSSTVPLAAYAVFTGTSENVSEYSQINVVALADSTGTLSMQFSTDGTNWDRKINVSIASGTSEAHTLAVIDPYFRIVFTNGSVAQTVFRMMATYNKFQSKGLVSRTSQSIDKDKDVDLVRNVANFPLDVARGLYDYIDNVHKFGRNPDVGTTEEDVWADGGTFNWQTEALAVRIKSGGNAADDEAGNGARTIRIVGLDENWTEQEEVITTQGVDASTPTTTQFIRVTRAYIENVGAYTGANTGNIVIESTAGVTVAQIAAGLGQTQLAFYTVPDDQTCYMTKLAAYVSSNKTANVIIYQRRNADTTAAPFTGKRLVHEFDDLSGQALYEHTNFTPSFPAKTDIWAAAVAATSAAVDVDFELFCVTNSGSPGNPT